MRLLAALSIPHPLVGQIQRPIDEGGAMVGGVEQEDADLLILASPRCSTVLARHPCRLGSLLHEPRLIHHHHARRRVPQVLDHIAPQLVAHRLRVPIRVGVEALHPLWARLAQPFGELPAILALQRGQQPLQIAPHPLAHLPPVEIAPDALVHLIQRPHRSHRCQDLVRLPLVRCQALLCHVLTSPTSPVQDWAYCRAVVSPLKGTPKTVTLDREADGWYVCFSCIDVPIRPLPPTGQQTGVDLGIEAFATLSDGTRIFSSGLVSQSRTRAQDGAATRIATQERE